MPRRSELRKEYVGITVRFERGQMSELTPCDLIRGKTVSFVPLAAARGSAKQQARA